MTNKEKLLEELECAIGSVLGDFADEEYEGKITSGYLDEIIIKVKWYLDL